MSVLDALPKAVRALVRMAVAGLLGAWTPTASAAAGAPGHIVSINLCTDQLLLYLADPEQVASVSFLASDPAISNVVELARDHPSNRGMAEEVLAARPDLVLAGSATTPTTNALLTRLGLRIEVFDIPRTLAEARRQLERMGEILGREGRARRAVAALDAALVAAARSSRAGTSVLAYGGRGFTSGTGTLFDDLVNRIGLNNRAREYGIGGYGAVPLEIVATAPPDYLVLSDDYRRMPSLAAEALDHPALRQAVDGANHVVLPDRLWSCGGPWLAEAARRLSVLGAAECPESAP